MLALRAMIGLVCVVASIGFGFMLGMNYSTRASEDGLTVAGNADPLFERSKQRVAALQQQVATLEKGAEIDHATAVASRTEMARTRAEIVQLRREVSIYESLLDASARTRGLAVHHFEVERRANGQFGYRITLLQRTAKYARIRGDGWINITGLQNGARRTLAHEEVLPVAGSKSLPLDLVYFQVLEGELSLPAGFQPEQVQFTARITGTRAQRLDQTIDWVLQETST